MMGNKRNLRKNIQTIFIVLIITLSIFSINTNAEKITIENNIYISEIPEWDLNTSWTYNIKMIIKENNSEFILNCESLKTEIIEIGQDTYNLQISGNVKGNGKIAIFGDIDQIAGVMDGYIKINKTNYIIEEIYDIFLRGCAKKGIIVVPFEWKYNTIISEPKLSPLSLPLYVGKNWTVPPSNVTFKGYTKFDDVTKNINITQNITGKKYICKETTNYYLKEYGKNLFAYNVSEVLNNKCNYLYSPNVSFFVKFSIYDIPLGNGTISIFADLIDSSFIEGNRSDLSINITKPKKNTYYIFGREIKFFHPRITTILGRLKFEVDVKGGVGKTNVSLYINDELKETLDSSPYVFSLNYRFYGRKYKVDIVAEDEYGVRVVNSSVIRIYNFLKFL